MFAWSDPIEPPRQGGRMITRIRLNVARAIAVTAGVALAGLGGATAPLLASPNSRPLLRVVVSGRGSVTSSPKGIACPKRCSAAYPTDARVRLFSHPAAGWRFSHWADGCTGSRQCVTKMAETTVVRAAFIRS
jgi:hypothetical protein